MPKKRDLPGQTFLVSEGDLQPRPRPDPRTTLTRTEHPVYVLIERSGTNGRTVPELTSALEWHEKTVRNAVKRMWRDGVLRKTGATRERAEVYFVRKDDA